MGLQDFTTKLKSKKTASLDESSGVISNKKNVTSQQDESNETNKKFSIKTMSLQTKILGVCVIIVLIFGLIVLQTVKKSKSDEIDFYDTLNSMVTQQLGSFNYTLEVNTSPITETQTDTTQEVSDENSDTSQEVSDENSDTSDVGSEESTELKEEIQESNVTTETNTVSAEALTTETNSVDDLNNVANAETETNTNTDKIVNETDILTQNEEEKDTSSRDFVNWTAETNDYWQYPNYRVDLVGCTMSLDPVTTQFSVNVSTQEYSDVFTTVTAVDGTYYLDLYSIKQWLLNSNETYLINLAADISDDAKYVMIKPEEFQLISTYSEDGEYELSAATSLAQTYGRLHTMLDYFSQILESAVGTSCTTIGENVAKINVTGDDGVKLAKKIRSYVYDYRSFYTSLSEVEKERGYMTDSQLKQAYRELDNRDLALAELRRKFDTTEIETMNMNFTGEIHNGTTSSGNFAVESLFNMSFNLDNKAYNIKLKYNRTGDTMEIKEPSEGKIMPISKLSDNFIVYKLSDIMQYFDVFGIKFKYKTEITPNSIKSDMLNSFCKLVNSLGTYDKYLTETNVYSYIEKYRNYEDTNDSNYILVNDFITMLSSVTDTIGVTNDENNYTPQNLTQNFELKGYNITLVYDEELSDAHLKVWNGTAFKKSNKKTETEDKNTENNVETEDNTQTNVSNDTTEESNKSKKSKTFDLTRFNLKTLLNSKYPANSSTLLQSYGGVEFDMSNVPTEIDISNKDAFEFKLYFVTDEDLSQMNLYYDDEFVCQLVNY